MRQQQAGTAMRVQKKDATAQGQRSKYVFAARPATQGEDSQTKVCPRCGEVLFSDMDVCYGCLYDFTRDATGRLPEAKPGASPFGLAARVPLVDDSLSSIAIDEIDDDEAADTARDADQPPAREIPPQAQKGRHRRVTALDAGSADDTLDLSPVAARKESHAAGISVLVSSPTMRVCVPVPKEGLLVGRDESNDIVLRSRTVSRNHLRLVPCGDGLAIEDLGSTNPALFLGSPVGQKGQIGPGQSVAVCDTTLTVLERGTPSAAETPTEE